MNPNKRKPQPNGAAHRRDPQPERIEEDVTDWFDPEEYDASGSKAASFENDDDDDEDGEEIKVAVAADGAEEDEDDEPAGKHKKHKNGKTFFETLGDGLRSAGETAQRFTQISMTRARLERLRFQLRTAHAQLGELAMRCWADAPDLGLTANDPAVVDAVKKIKLLRRAIREKQAKIAELRKNEPVEAE